MSPPTRSEMPVVPELSADPGHSLAQNTADQQRSTAEYKDTTIPSRPQQNLLPVHQPRPVTPSSRRESGTHANTQTTDLTATQPRPRNQSPFSRTHLRSRSTTAPASMSRAQSLPPRSASPYSPNMSSGRISPLPRSPKRSGSPFRPVSRESDHSATAPSFYDGFEDIPEDGELDLSTHPTERTVVPSHYGPMKPTRSLSGRRQRPASPVSGQLISSASSPSLSSSGRFNETYPGLHHYGSYSSISSMPSTPSSNRSRSPSIVSLDTIEDAPDAEWEAIEADRIAKLKAAADAEDQDEEEPQRRSSLEMPGQRPVGFGFGRQNQRKRWSVCGAERRADLDLETIWED